MMQVGDAVLYCDGQGTTHLGRVLAVAQHDGDIDIEYTNNEELRAYDVKRGSGKHTYQPLNARLSDHE